MKISKFLKNIYSCNKIMEQNVLLKEALSKKNKQIESIIKKVEHKSKQIHTLKNKIIDMKENNKLALSNVNFDVLDYNTSSSMDEFYSDPKNLDKYRSSLQSLVYQEFFKTLSSFVTLSDLIILDVGCGIGHFTNHIFLNSNRCKIEGADFSEKALAIASSRNEKINFFKHDVYNSFQNKYDLITCTEVLEHLQDPEKVLKIILSSLKSEGHAFITVPDGRIDQSFKHVNFWSPESWVAFITQNAPNYNCSSGVISSKDIQGLRYNFSVIRNER